MEVSRAQSNCAVCFSAIFLAFATAVPAGAQIESGVPGDNIPDIYYFQDTGLLQVDTDGVGLVAVLVQSANRFVHHQDESPCILCDGDRIEGQEFTAGYINNSSQWIRVSPILGPGPLGTIDLSAGFSGLTDQDFPRNFDGYDGSWSVVYASDRSTHYTNVTVVGGGGSAGESFPPAILPEVDPDTLESWTNPEDPVDINGDGAVVAQDALIVVNELAAFGTRPLYGPKLINFLDATGDGYISPWDAIYVINRVNAAGSRAASSGGVAVPEPSSGLAWCVGWLLLVCRGRR